MLKSASVLVIIIVLAIPVFATGTEVQPEKFSELVPEPGALVGRTICVDPGHGGTDTGTLGIDGAGYPEEKDHNLDMALYLKELLLEKGATVIMTRETDITVSLADRCTIANNANAEIFLSIHCNSIGSETTQGTETFYWGVDAGTYSVNGSRLAENINEEQVDHLGSNDRGAKMDFPYFGFHLYVLANTAMPAALTEVGFMSNQTEFDNLNTTWYRNLASEAMLDGILRYFRTESSPIRINSDGEMTAMDISEGWVGDGSAGNPYIVEEYDIDGTGAGYCMYIGNVSQYFIVRNCSLHRASGIGTFVNWLYDTGLYIYNSPNAAVDNVTGYLNGGYGIRVQNSNNADIKYSDGHMNGYYGIYSRYSDFVDISECSTNNNTHSGVIIYGSDNNSIQSCEIMDNNAYGIYMDGGITNQISGNSIINSADYGIYMFNSLLCNISGNIVNEQNEIGIYNLNSDFMTIYDNEVRFSGDTGIEISSTSNNNVVSWNQVSNTPLYGIQIGDNFGAADYNDVHNNTVNDTDFFGIYVLKSSNNEIHGNTAFWNGEFGIYVKLSQFIDVHDNLAYDNVYGICLRYSSHDVTVRNNTCHSNNRFAASYITAGIALEFSTYDNTVTGNDVYNQNIFNGTGILLQYSDNNIIQSNNMSGNVYGAYLYDENYSKLSRNDIASNQLGVFISDYSTDNTIASNSFYNNAVQANESSTFVNHWDAGYPAGGNYWSDFSGADIAYGQAQGLLGSDGIIDTQYLSIQNTSSMDNYPLASPFNYTEHEVALLAGWNLISLPMRQLNWSFDEVLASITGKYDKVCAYYPSDTINPWRSYIVGRPAIFNDLGEMSHFNGYWVRMTEPALLTTSGDIFSSQLSIPLKAGWNLVDHPALSGNTLDNIFAGTGYDRAEIFDDGAPYLISQVDGAYVLQPGQGVWVRVPGDTIWTI